MIKFGGRNFPERSVGQAEAAYVGATPGVEESRAGVGESADVLKVFSAVKDGARNFLVEFLYRAPIDDGIEV
jgi:hypothetical protein